MLCVRSNFSDNPEFLPVRRAASCQKCLAFGCVSVFKSDIGQSAVVADNAYSLKRCFDFEAFDCSRRRMIDLLFRRAVSAEIHPNTFLCREQARTTFQDLAAAPNSAANVSASSPGTFQVGFNRLSFRVLIRCTVSQKHIQIHSSVKRKTLCRNYSAYLLLYVSTR